MLRKFVLFAATILLVVASAACQLLQSPAPTPFLASSPSTPPTAVAVDVPGVETPATVLADATEVTARIQSTPTLVTTTTPTVEPGAIATAEPGATFTSEPNEVSARGVDERITFEPGAKSATVENAVVRGTTDRYILWAEAGQTMNLALSSLEDNAALFLYSPAGELLAGTEAGEAVKKWQGRLPLAGDYGIVIITIRGNATYTLDVTIPPTVAVEPTRVSFEPGTVYTQVRAELQAGQTHRYVLHAMKEQNMSVTVQAATESVFLSVEDEVGHIYLSSADKQPVWWRPALPATQDYIIGVTAIDESVEYVLDIGISALDDQPERIQFESGSTSATISGSLAPGGDLNTYILHAAEGQMVLVSSTLDSRPLNIYLRSADDEHFFYDLDGRLEAELPWSGDYVLSVSTPNAAGVVDYELLVTIE